MLILTIRADKPEAEIGLFDDDQELAYEKWQAHRELAETILSKIEQLLKNHHKIWQDIEGIICYKGPGSFTGLRIGLTVGNTLAYGLDIPIVAMLTGDWIRAGTAMLQEGGNQKIVLPHYGSEPKVTKPKK